METISNQHLVGQHVRLDGRHFRDCTLSDCVLEYAGGAVVLERTHFRSCTHLLRGPAQRTLSFLETMGIVEPASAAVPVGSGSELIH